MKARNETLSAPGRIDLRDIDLVLRLLSDGPNNGRLLSRPANASGSGKYEALIVTSKKR